MRVEVYSDVVCPWCYIGERRFARALESFEHADDIEVVFRPFQLDPESPRSAVPLEQYLKQRYGTQAQAMMDHAGEAAAGEGIEMNWDAALAANTLDAHRLLRFAEREYGAAVQRALAEKLFALHFAHGGDLTDLNELVEAADAVGMNANAVRTHLQSDDGVREVEAEIEAAHRLGIRAVPTFVMDGRYAVQGAQPPSTFLQVLARVREETAESAEPSSGRPGEHTRDAS